jgi:protein gp37
MNKTKIEWLNPPGRPPGGTWSPWWGCRKVSPGCANCYAERMADRFRGGAPWGMHDEKSSKSPLTWNRTQPGKLVFPSMCDWLQPEVPPEMLARFMDVVQQTPNLTWMLLTKRPEAFQDRMDHAYNHIQDHQTARMIKLWVDLRPPTNVWVGTSVEDQQRMDERNAALLSIPAAHRFISFEPLLGPVDAADCEGGGVFKIPGTNPKSASGQGIDWVIVGGESGPGARPCNIEWIRDIRDQCASAGVPCFVKQLGSRPVVAPCRQNHFDWRYETSNADRPDNKMFVEDGDKWRVLLKHPKGGDPAEWPSDLRVQQWPKGLL